jgi:glucokinase
MRKHLVWLLPDEIPDEGIPEKEDRMLAQGYRQLWPGRQRKETEERSTARQLLSLANCDLNQVTAELIALAAKNGNRLAQRHLKKVCRLLGWAIAQVITLLCPRRIVIGGGVSLIGEELLFAPLRNAAARYTFGPFADCYEIVPAALGESVVVHGALRLAKEAMSTRSD